MSISQEPSSSVILEVAKNNFSSAIREVAKKWSINPELAETLLAEYEKNKNSILKYTREDLKGLRDVLKIDSPRDLFWDTEISALRNIVRSQVTLIIPKNEVALDPLKQKPAKERNPWNMPPLKEVMLAQKNYAKCKDEIQPAIDQFAPIVDVNPQTVLAVCAQESRFNTATISPAGAQGVMQIMPATMNGITRFLAKGKMYNAWPEEKYYAQVRDKVEKQGFDINQWIASSTKVWKNIAIGTIYLWYLTGKYGDTEGLRRYNGAKGWSLENRSYVSGVTAWKNLIASSRLSTDTTT